MHLRERGLRGSEGRGLRGSEGSGLRGGEGRGLRGSEGLRVQGESGDRTYECRPWTPPSTWADMVLFSNFSSPEYIMDLDQGRPQVHTNTQHHKSL